MEGADEPSRHPKTLFSLNSVEDIKRFALGCDADNGGTSTVNLELDESSQHTSIIGRPTAKFWGDMRLGVRPDSRLARGGYAAMKSKASTILLLVPPFLTDGLVRIDRACSGTFWMT